MNSNNSMYDRVLLNEKRIEEIANDMRKVETIISTQKIINLLKNFIFDFYVF
jgi:gamma-glutamyl phosphate reductase